MTEKDELIQLSSGIGTVVAEQLRDKYGINKFGGKQLFDFRFTKEELSKITELKIDKNNWVLGLNGVQLLPNLKKLVIETMGEPSYEMAKDILSITDKDMSCIEKCTNLEFLSIINQTNLSFIYLDKLTRLRELHIDDNENVEAIYGIDKLTKLEKFSCYGNNALQEVEKLEDAIIAGVKKNFRYFYSGLKELNLDVRLFPKAIGYNAKNGSYNKMAIDGLRLLDNVARGAKEDFTKFGRVVWSESVSRKKSILIGTDDMVRMHNEACRILNDIIKPFSRDMDKIVAVEKYLAENVTYDRAALKSYEAHKIPEPKNKDGRLIGPKYGANGAYDCIINKNCVCQGYTRGEQYLLGLLGIKTREVSCWAVKDQSGFSNLVNHNDKYFNFKIPDGGYHSVICIDAENGYYYSDPCWNACLYQRGVTSLPYTLLSKEEISKDHTLSPIEAVIGEAPQKISRQQVKLLFEQAVKRQKMKMQAGKDDNVAGVINDTRIRMNDFLC
jgi:hypothetical protein